MASTPIIIAQDLWVGEPHEGVISCWLYAEGATVTQGDVLAEIMVEKGEMEVKAPASGRLHILLEQQALFERGTVIGEIDG